MQTVSFGFHVGRGRQREMTAADQHNEIELNYVERGTLTLRHGAEIFTLSKGDALLYWAAIPHQVTVADIGTEISWMVLPLSWFLEWNLHPRFSRSLLSGEALPVPSNPGWGELSSLLQRWARDYSLHVPEMQSILELEVQAFFRRLAFHYPKRKPAYPGSLSPGRQASERMQQMVRLVTERFRDPLTIPQIAAAAGLHPEYAMRLFRKRWGMTLWDFVLQQRIFEAKRLLILEGSKISDIAFECGFGSASRFYSAFSKSCGCTPLAFRRRHKVAEAPETGSK